MVVGEAVMPEAARSLRSLARHAGVPSGLALGSDGTLEDAAAGRLREAAGLSGVPVRAVEPDADVLAMAGSAGEHPLVRKLAFLVAIGRVDSGPTLFVDADIVFFRGADRLADDLAGTNGQPAYMGDPQPSLDGRLLRDDAEWYRPVNSGLVWMPQPLDWTRALDRFAALGGDFEPTHFTEQTAVHLAVHDTAGVALDSDRYVLAGDDQFAWRDRHARRPGVVCRHYVRPVRHKMWLLADPPY